MPFVIFPYYPSPLAHPALISNLISSKSASFDAISSIILKSSPDQLSVPLTNIINTSIKNQSFPPQWKSALVYPLHKSGPISVCSNYRPISILPAASKVFELYIADILRHHLEYNSLLYPLQSGFRCGHSTQSLLLYLTDSWYKSLDNNQLVGVVFLDISKAFDTINHDLLLHKLKVQFKLSDSLCCLLRSYLSQRFQAVSYNGSTSEFLSINSGVPQGSILGPILFSMFINDLPNTIQSSVTTALFADDSTFFVSGNNVDSIELSLNNALSAIHSWMVSNGLCVNLSKTKSMLIHSSRKHPPPLKIVFNGSPIEQVVKFRLLGVVVDQHLKWNHHIDYILKIIVRNLHLLRRISWFLPRQTLITFYFSYIASHFNYCSLVWDPCCSSNLK